jgi:mono/diheme cytochrome c family protein
MTIAPKRKTRLTLFLLLLVLSVAAFSIVYAAFFGGPWFTPEAAKKVKNPLAASEFNLAATRSLYLDKCAECHGDSGKGDGPKAGHFGTRPSNLTDTQRYASMTDGELYYKITHGHHPMPGFKKRLSDTQRWQLVLLIRNFSHASGPR